MGTHTEWTPPDPPCDMCATFGIERPAVVDCKMITGPWALLCEVHWRQFGIHYPDLGTGKGQRLIQAAC